MNTFVSHFAPKLYHIILGPVKGFCQKTTKIIVTVWAVCYNLFLKKFCVGLAFGRVCVYNTFIGAKRYNLRIPAVSGNWKLNG